MCDRTRRCIGTGRILRLTQWAELPRIDNGARTFDVLDGDLGAVRSNDLDWNPRGPMARRTPQRSVTASRHAAGGGLWSDDTPGDVTEIFLTVPTKDDAVLVEFHDLGAVPTSIALR
jgi:hypothetical protein